MGKLSVFAVAALALVLGGCAGQVDGPEVFEIRAIYPHIADLCSEAAERINTDELVVTVRLVSIAPGSELPNAVSAPLTTYNDPTAVSVTTNAHTNDHEAIPGYAIEVGAEADVDAVEAAIRDWIALVHPD